MFSLGPNASSEPIAANRVSDTIAGGYTQIPQKFYHPNASRNALGLIGGNDVSLASGNLVDVESELRNITRDLSQAPAKKYAPSCPLGSGEPLHGTGRNPSTMLASVKGTCPEEGPTQLVFTERSTGKLRTVAMELRHLPTTQYVSYPGVPAPEPLTQDVYGHPWRF